MRRGTKNKKAKENKRGLNRGSKNPENEKGIVVDKKAGK